MPMVVVSVRAHKSYDYLGEDGILKRRNAVARGMEYKCVMDRAVQINVFLCLQNLGHNLHPKVITPELLIRI